MSWRGILALGTKYLRRLQKFPVVFLKQPRLYLLPRYSVQYPRAHPNISRLSKYFGHYTQRNTLVRAIYRTLVNSSTQQRPNSLLRAYRGFAGSVQLRHYLHSRSDNSFRPINEVCKPKHESWFSNLFGTNKYQVLPSLATNSAESIVPKEFIASGCNSAVWAAEVRQQKQQNNSESADRLAVKVLYNYYANSSYDGPTNTESDSDNNNNALKDIPESWILLHRQIQRECELRPQTNHPNIVPLVGHFIDRAPQNTSSANCTSVDKTPESYTCTTSHGKSCIISSDKVYQPVNNSVHSSCMRSQCWPGAESFSEGFGGQPYTFYMLMPRFEATLDDILRGNIKFDLQNLFTEIDHDRIKGPVQSTCGDNTAMHISLEHHEPRTLDLSTPKSADADLRSSVFDSNLSSVTFIKHAQLFEAVAELEAHGIAHRDIKPNNILIRRRVLPEGVRISGMKSTSNSVLNSTSNPPLTWLNGREVELTNSYFHVALTDFGCAVRTGQSSQVSSIASQHQWRFKNILTDFVGVSLENNEYLNHSGNTALLAPEIACTIHQSSIDNPNQIHMITNQDYARSDIWAAATLIYPLFGMSNPFVDGTLSSADYTESSLPQLPPESPKIMTWILHKCLKRDPFERPKADEIADILHTWCLIRHLHRRQKTGVFKDLFQPQINGIIADIDVLAKDFTNLAQLNDVRNLESNERLCELLNIFWAADWLMGAARPPHGIRSLFYSRATPGRLALCLNTIHCVELSNTQKLVNSVFKLIQA
ncbi:unnamed protein product [Heterobilharzia americana]|nr:unnamed protein product [Heterobilharzia americana]